MTEVEKGTQQPTPAGGIFGLLWRHKSWWLLSLGVLLLLIGILYLLTHMSAADPEMYPTTLSNSLSFFRAC